MASFSKSFHPHMPCVDTTIPAQTIQATSPFLFWTIIFTASRYHVDHVSKSNLLMAPYSDMINQAVLKASHSLHTIQAILYLSMWPLPVMHQPEDPSLMYAGIAVYASASLGLPQSAGPMSRTLASIESNDRHTMARTWLACFTINTS
jgi:hypothetical protein